MHYCTFLLFRNLNMYIYKKQDIKLKMAKKKIYIYIYKARYQTKNCKKNILNLIYRPNCDQNRPKN